MSGIDAYPLTWPDGWKRTRPGARRGSTYRVRFAKARDDIVRSLGLMGVGDWNVIISSNVPLRRDGLPYANTAEPTDPGVAVYWTKDRQRRVIACDTWRTVRENLRAVGLTIDALRMLERTGASEILDRAFTGFAALPPSAVDWPLVLGVDRSATREAIEASYRELALKHHPDRGGDPAMMVKINAARVAALAEVVR